MPNLLAHRLLIEKISEGIQLDPDIKSTLLIATQGPDPLFYYGLMPWRGIHLLAAKKRYGSKIHHTDAKSFMNALFNSYEKIKDEKQKKVFLAFIVGQYFHHLLDKEAHPFIYYFSGFNEEGRLKGIYHYEHANFESLIDSCLMKEFPELDFYNHTQDALKTDKHLLKMINIPLRQAMKEFLNAKVSRHYYTNSVKNMISMQKLSNKKMIRKITGKHSMFNALYTPKDVKGDPLNLDNKTWYHPISHEAHSESFIDIHQRVQEKARRVLLDYLEGKVNRDYILNQLDEYDYNGCRKGEKLTYWYKLEENKND